MAIGLEKEWYTTEEAENITGYDSRNFTRQIRKGKITNYKKEEKHYLIHKDVIQEYVNEKELIENFYISYNDTAILLGKKVKAIQDLSSLGVFKDTMKFGVNSYISKIEVEKHLKRISETLSTTEASEITGLSWNDIRVLIEKDILEAEQVDNYLWYISKDSFDCFVKEIKQGYTVEDICSDLSTGRDEINRFIAIDWLKVYDIKGIGLRARKKDYEDFRKKKEELYTVQDICEELDLKPGVVRQSIILKGLVRGYLEGGHGQIYVVPKEEIKRFSSTLEGIRLIYFGKEDYNRYYNEFMNALQKLTEHKDTVEVFNIWAKDKINKSKATNKKYLVNYMLITIEKLNKALPKEIYHHNNEEIRNLLSDEKAEFSVKDIGIISGFLNYCKRKRKCMFTEGYSVHNIIDKKKSIEKIVYSKADWVAYCTHLTDIEKHRET